MTAETHQTGEDGPHRQDEVPLSRGLSTKLLLLTVLFVLIAEVLIFLPSIASFRLRWLEERLATAATVGILLVETDPDSLSRRLQDDVLIALGAKAVAVRDEGTSQLLMVADMPPQVDVHVNVAATPTLMAMREAIGTLVWGGSRILRVYGPVGASPKEFELIIDEHGLRRAMLAYSANIAIVSLILSLITATLLYYAIDRIMIRPVRRMTRSMLDFSEAPDDASRMIVPSPRGDELGVAERELASMQDKLQRMLRQQRHLADLGLAVSKINHDMRNILAAAQLISDRLATVRDPTAQTFVPRLVRALDRAVSYSEGVLAYGHTQEPPPRRRRLRLAQLVDEVNAMLGTSPGADVELINAVPPELEIDADAEQLFRVLLNLSRNAVQAMAQDGDRAVVKRLTIGAGRAGGICRVTIEDTGPGLPARARENLFSAFRGSARSGGTGLGLAIAHELVRAHGGTIELVESRGGRTVFAIEIPDQPVDFESARMARLSGAAGP